MFIFAYLGLIAGACLLVGLCFVLGWLLFVSFPHFFTALIGIGLVGFGVLTLVFLLKFVFSGSKTDRSGMLELTEADQPELFAMIRQLSREIQTQFPKKIYLVPGVTAFVFYNSTFWSMFFPVKKNLAIGMGLLNTLNLSELKGVIAHEFGHFSQKTMRHGSFIYQFNQVIFNLVSDNEGYQRTLDAFASIHAIFALLTHATVFIIRGIIQLMKQMYVWMNKKSLALRREMEFHADAVAASVSGGNNLISAFRRLELGEEAYQRTFHSLNQSLAAQNRVENVFEGHRAALQILAEAQALEIRQGLPVVKGNRPSDSPRVIFKDQWASHPSNADRIQKLQELGFEASPVDTPARAILRKPETVEGYFTQAIYSSVTFEHTPQILARDTMYEALRKQIFHYTFNPVFEGYYDQRLVEPFEVEAAIAGHSSKEEIVAFYAGHAGQAVHRKRTLEAIGVLSQIQAGQIEADSFDLDGLRYETTDAADQIRHLQQELEAADAQFRELDQQVFGMFMATGTPEQQARLIAAYKEMFAMDESTKNKISPCQNLFNLGQLLLSGQASIEQLREFQKAVQACEPEMRQELAGMMDTPEVRDYLHPANLEGLQAFLKASYTYTDGKQYDTDEIPQLLFAIQQYTDLISEAQFLVRKKAFDLQASML